jgi:hypothetical protein
MDVDTTVIGLFGVFFLSDIAAMPTKLKAFAMLSVYEYLARSRALKRPVGRPPNEVRRSHTKFTYQAGS